VPGETCLCRWRKFGIESDEAWFRFRCLSVEGRQVGIVPFSTSEPLNPASGSWRVMSVSCLRSAMARIS
jgi:hypothetical protein